MQFTESPFVALGADEGQSVTVGGNHVIFKVMSEHSQGDMMIVHYAAPAHFPGPSLHIHAHTDEAFYVLTGTLTVRVEGTTRIIGPGGMAFVQRGTAHTFANPADEPVTMLIVMTPGGFEGYFQGMADLAKSGLIGDPDAVAALQSRYDLETVQLD